MSSPFRGAFAVAVQIGEFVLDEQLLAIDVAFLEDGAVAVERVGIDISVINIARELHACGQLA